MSWEAWGTPEYMDGDCPTCDGTGTVDDRMDDVDLEHTCPDCGGSGFRDDGYFEDDVI